ncbi:GIY-YIG nuclease family protein [Streptomyces heilongjiangensis]|uniref:GIY-YIG nuclease family protein n=1 Tax=Streptomyces heilongjiangensis TaxID=945052 RepID=A0ABW1BIM6_9ACTN|nr:GIY-YIG nuclease family protein [Streptomyces heilongjiangensis]MDC2951050.1 MarR family transcriptional regulator [Streptomyces heilongjiangensis]
MGKRRSGRWVYLIGSPDTRPVKIGVSNDPTARLADLQTGSAARLMILWQTPGGQALESALHAYFAPYRTHGEWFDFGEENPAALVATAAVLMGHRSQPVRVEEDARYRYGDCTACASNILRAAAIQAAVMVMAAASTSPRRTRPTPPPPAPAIPAQGSTPSNAQRVLATIRAGTDTQKAIAEATGMHKGTVSKAVSRLAREGLVRRIEGDRFTLVKPMNH